MSTSLLLYHNQGNGSPIGGGDILRTETFSIPNIVFTENMYKREGLGPYNAAPIIQGAYDGSGTPDIISVSQGYQVNQNFYAYFDGYQGSVVKWWKPELSRDAIHSNDEYLWYVSSAYYCRYSHTDQRLEVAWGGQTHTYNLTTIAGTEYFVVVRGDTNNSIDGTNYISISVDDSHTYGAATGTSSAPDANIYFGSDGNNYPANAILAGTTIFRRPLFDGTHPSKLSGLSDEIAEIYAGGTGTYPELIARNFDICFQLSTDETQSILETGSGTCWSFPWGANLLTNWHLQNATGGEPDNWTIVNGATCTDGASSDILFDIRIQKISVDSDQEGIKQAFVSTPGNGYYLATWLKTGGVDQGVNVIAYDATNEEIISFVTTDSDAYTRLEMTFEAPTGCTSTEIYIQSADNDSYDIHVAEVIIMNNTITNPSMEQTYIPET